MNRAGRSVASYVTSFALAVFVYWCTVVLVSPSFWATIPVGNRYVGALKIAAAIATFVIVRAFTRPGN